MYQKRFYRGRRACSPGNFLKIYIVIRAILVFFLTSFRESLSYFWPLTLSASPMMHFVRTVYACLRRLRHIVMKRFKIMKKFYSSKTLLKVGGCLRSIPHIPPESAPGCIITKDGLKLKRYCYGKLLNVIMFVRQLPLRSRVDPPDLLLNDHQLRSLLYVIMVLRLSRSVVGILINGWLELAAFCWN